MPIQLLSKGSTIRSKRMPNSKPIGLGWLKSNASLPASSSNTSTRPVRALLPPTRRPLSSVMISNPARPANQQRGKSRGTYEADDSNSFVGILRSCLGAEPGCDPGHADDNEVGAAEKSVGLRRGVGGFAA